MLIKLNQTQRTNYCHHPGSSHFPQAWQSCSVFHKPQNLRSSCVAQINKSSSYLQTPVLHNRPSFWFIVPSVACEAWKHFLISFIWPAVSGENPGLNPAKYGTVLFYNFISLYYFQYSYKSIISCPPQTIKTNICSLKKFSFTVLLFLCLKNKTYRHFLTDFKKHKCSLLGKG